MISAKNYAAQAEAGIKKWALKADYKHRDYDVFFCDFLARLIMGAVHFAIPDNGEIFDDDLKGIDGVQVRLPYPVITVEYYVDDKKSKYCEAAPVYSPRRLVLACESKKCEVLKYQEKLGVAPEANFFERFPDEDLIQIFAMYEADGVWLPCAMSWMMPITWDYSPDGQVHLVTKPLVDPRSNKYFTGTPVPMLPGFFALMCERYGKEKALQVAMHDISGEIRAVLELCEALTCSNVTTETIQQENKKANAKRLKNGKLPIYETKTLAIEVPRSTQRTGIKQGDRSSPRQHLRRGHIRRLQDDKRIWVNSCVVGSSDLGRVDKSYRVFSA